MKEKRFKIQISRIKPTEEIATVNCTIIPLDSVYNAIKFQQVVTTIDDSAISIPTDGEPTFKQELRGVFTAYRPAPIKVNLIKWIEMMMKEAYGGDINVQIQESINSN